MIPNKAKYIIVGAGIHGLSTAYHLARKLKARGEKVEGNILVIDKNDVGAGASGIACGVVRNNYFQPAMCDLMIRCTEIWNEMQAELSYHPVGYMQISPESMHAGVASIFARQCEAGFDSVFIEGERECSEYMRKYFSDWQARGITSILHERPTGYANNIASMQALANLARAEGASILTPVTLTGFRLSGGAVSSVLTDRGEIACGHVILGLGPWLKQAWDMLELPKAIDIKSPDGNLRPNVPMWHFSHIREGTLGVDPNYQQTNDGNLPPVLHVDCEEPLYDDLDGTLITEKLWGIYYKPDFHFGGVQGGASPVDLTESADDVAVDPYGWKSEKYTVGDDFARMWVSALAFCQKRFQGKYQYFRHEPSGGIGIMTPDCFPVFDVFHENCYIIADSSHGYKMIAVGELVAGELLGTKSSLLEPFRFSRYGTGKLHPVSASPFPWS